MTKKLLVYIPYDFSNPSRGSSVRPYYLVKELEKLGETYLISGSIAEKRRQIREFKKSWRKEGPLVEALYLESMNHPFRPFEIIFFTWLMRHGVRMSLFVRDIHWEFPTAFLNHNLKERIKRYRQQLEYLFFPRIFDLCFSPSVESVAYLKKMGFKRVEMLPPAGLVIDKIEPSLNRMNLIYVGGVGGDRGENLLITAYEKLKKDFPRITLTIIGNGEPDSLRKYQGMAGVEIHTDLNAKDLAKFYRNASIALIPLASNPYYEIARTIKIYEYMSYGLPVVTTPRKEMANLVRSEAVGVVAGDSAESFARAIQKLIEDEGLYKKYSQNALNSIKSENTWSHRAKKILKVLGE